MKILNLFFLGLFFLNSSIILSSEYNNNQLKTIIKYAIFRPNVFPEYIFTDECNNIIDPLRLRPKIYMQFGADINDGYWIDNPLYIQHILVERIINLDQ